MVRGRKVMALLPTYDFTLHFLQHGGPDSRIQSLPIIRLGGYSSGAALLPIPPISSWPGRSTGIQG